MLGRWQEGLEANTGRSVKSNLASSMLMANLIFVENGLGIQRPNLEEQGGKHSGGGLGQPSEVDLGMLFYLSEPRYPHL